MLMQETPGPVPDGIRDDCPCCGTDRDVIPIVYSAPTPHLRAAQRKGKILISDLPCGLETKYCKNCGTQW